MTPTPTRKSRPSAAATCHCRSCWRNRIISLHCPLTADSKHLINSQSLAGLQPGAMLINTGRGALVDTPALIEALKSGQLGYLGLDVYEEEAQLFFEDRSDLPLQDDVLARLLTFPNVIVTAREGIPHPRGPGRDCRDYVAEHCRLGGGHPAKEPRRRLNPPDRRSFPWAMGQCCAC